MAVSPLPVRAAGPAPFTVYLPLHIAGAPTCAPIPGERYAAVSVAGPPTDRPAEEHADLNLAVRGHVITQAYAGLVDLSGPADPYAPQLAGLFPTPRVPEIRGTYQVYGWEWAQNARGDPIADPPVTLVTLAGVPGEVVRVPDSGYTIGDGFEVLVLYAAPRRITLKYTREDNVVGGYTLHLEGVCVEPSLLALYGAMDAQGRSQLPALRAGQALGRVWGGESGVAIRDAGQFLDPRSRKDWWQGY